MEEKYQKPSSFTSKDGQEHIETFSTTSKDAPFVPSKAEQKLVKKLNWSFMPFVCVLIFVQFLDKTILSTISVLPEFFYDTGISKDQFGWLGSFFYLGFLCMQLPNNYLMQKFTISKYIGVILVIWGGSLLAVAWATNFSQLAALRFLLGFFEATSYPCMFLLIATMYRRAEQVVWFGVLFMSNSIAMILGGLIGAGIMKMPTVGTISPWKWAFIIFGSITTVMGLVYFIFLPDRPTSRWYRLTEDEKAIVEERSRDNAVVPTLQVNYNQIREALREPRLYVYCLIALLIELQNGALTLFQTLIISDLGYNSFDSMLLTIPSGVVSLVLMYASTQISKKKGEIIWVAIVTCGFSLVGLVLLLAIPSGGAKLLGLYLSWGCTPTYTLMQASISSNVSGYTKKIFYTSASLISYTLGNFIGPLLLIEKDKPRYFMGMGIYVAANVVVILLFLFLRYSYTQANKKRHLDKSTNIVALPGDLEDITDAQNPNFVYRT
ncbi:hypothetical protein MFLAVUS_008904 [Mucor flavus]|uniref:Major facilitator superfamily (MFS) profile domain-containing protein n=1 Tax=Mucor flavus TaxID=439312 RepID=A0ABP9Z8E1_9FUNG